MVHIDKDKIFELWKQKEVRLGRNLTVKEASELSGSSEAAIRKIRDNATYRFDARTLDGLCRLLDVPDGPVSFIVYKSDAR